MGRLDDVSAGGCFERALSGWTAADDRAQKNGGIHDPIRSNRESFMNVSSRLYSARWPFWLLMVAWVCANSPQAATYAFLTWMAEARSFAHQQRLSIEVAVLLGGQTPSERVARAENSSPAQSLPAVPLDAVLKKLPLALERAPQALPPDSRSELLRSATVLCPESVRPPPPLGPPRTNLG